MSAYGKGFAYNLGLFLAHAEREIPDVYSHLWFDGAYDHLMEIETSQEILGEKIAEEVNSLIELCYMHKSFHETEVEHTKKQIQNAIRIAKHILYLWDIKMGIDAVKGDYE